MRPPLPLENEVDAIVRQTKKQRVRSAFQLRAESDIYHAYRAVFFHDGELTREARIVLDDLKRAARMDKVAPLAKAEVLREREAMRALIVHLLARFQMPRARMERLARQIDQFSHDDSKD